MTPYTRVSPISMFPRLLIDVPLASAVGRWLPPKRLYALGMLLLLAPMVLGELSAQQASGEGYYSQDRSQDDQAGYGPPQADGQQAYPQPSYEGSSQMDSAPAEEPAERLHPQDLEQLVAPIALYPDALVAQVLTAATYPLQVANADRWLRAQGYPSPDQIVAGADAQPWDPSVKAMTAFPRVLAQMVENLNWTTELGNAYYNQPQDVLEAVQLLRRRAQAAGNLRSSPQQAVSYDQDNIVLAPPNPQVVYVPAYNPWAAYGQPVSPFPGFSVVDAMGSFVGAALDSSFGSSAGSSAVRFGLGVAMTAFTNAPWGWLGWGLNWLAQSVLFQHADYYSHSTTVADWGLPHGGPRAFSARGAEAANGWNRKSGGFGRSHTGFSGTGSSAFARTRDEDAYAANRPGQQSGRGYQTSGSGYGTSSQEGSRGFQHALARSSQSRASQSRAPQSRASQSRAPQSRASQSRAPQSRSQPSRWQRYNPQSRSQQYRAEPYGSRQYGSQLYRSQPYGSARSASTSDGRSAEGYGKRANETYRNSVRADRSWSAGFQRSGFGKGSYGGFKGRGFAESSGKRARSGGFHFGGGHAPKGSGGGKSFSRGHSGGGGHSGGHGHSGGKHHH